MSDDPTEFADEPIETGFTVTVNDLTPEEGLTAEAIQAAKALVNLPDISTVQLAQLAREVAQDIGMLPAIIQKYRLTQAHYDFLEKHNAFFRSILANEIKNWQSIRSTEVRLRLQAQAALEQQMPVIANRMGNAAEKLGDAVEAAKLFARIAGVDAAPSGTAAAGERFTINIDLGADTRTTVSVTGGPSPSPEASSQPPLRDVSPGARGPAALPSK